MSEQVGQGAAASLSETKGALVDPILIDLDAVVVDGDGNEDARLIRTDMPWAVMFEWFSKEPGATFETTEWRLDVLLKRVDPGEPRRLQVGPVQVPADAAQKERRYVYRFNISREFAAPHVGAVCRASATIAGWSKREGRLLSTGIADLGLLYFYEPAHQFGRRPSGVAEASVS